MSNSTCACGARIVVHLLLPSEVWERIADGDYALCALCIDERMHARGLKCEAVAVFHGKAVRTAVSEIERRAFNGWRPCQVAVALSGSVGHPMLYERKRP